MVCGALILLNVVLGHTQDPLSSSLWKKKIYWNFPHLLTDCQSLDLLSHSHLEVSSAAINIEKMALFFSKPVLPNFDSILHNDHPAKPPHLISIGSHWVCISLQYANISQVSFRGLNSNVTLINLYIMVNKSLFNGKYCRSHCTGRSESLVTST